MKRKSCFSNGLVLGMNEGTTYSIFEGGNYVLF
jgi:hypothetical protein